MLKSEEAEKLLREHYPRKSALEIARQTGMSEGGVHAIRNRIGISANLVNHKYYTDEIVSKIREMAGLGRSRVSIINEINKTPGNKINHQVLNKVCEKNEIIIGVEKDNELKMKKELDLNTTGAQCVMDGSYYKISRGLAFILIDDEWFRSTRKVSDIESYIEKQRNSNG